MTPNSPKMTKNCPKWPQNDPKLPKWPQNDPKWPKNYYQLKKIAQIYLQHLQLFASLDIFLLAKKSGSKPCKPMQAMGRHRLGNISHFKHFVHQHFYRVQSKAGWNIFQHSLFVKYSNIALSTETMRHFQIYPHLE